jgi:ABC-2 type transport system permease protein
VGTVKKFFGALGLGLGLGDKKKFRYGAFSALAAALFVALLLVVNLIVASLNLKYDLSADKKFSLSKQSLDILAGLERPVTIYALCREGTDDLQYRSLLKAYPEASGKISLVYRDPVKFPQFAEKFRQNGEDIPIDSVIVESGDRFRVIKADDLVTVGYDYSTYQQRLESIDIEPQVTNALRYVEGEGTVVVYAVTGHDEIPLTDAIAKQVKMAGYDAAELDLLKEDVPEDAAALLLAAPSRDYTGDEARKARDYLKNGGKALLTASYTPEKMPNFEALLEDYGVSFGADIALDANPRNAAGGQRQMLLPDYAEHEITRTLRNGNGVVCLYGSTIFERTGLVKSSVLIEPLLTTSSDSYAKNVRSGAQSLTIEREDGDKAGPFDVSVAITDGDTKIAAIGAMTVLDGSLNAYAAGGNATLIVNSLNWLAGAGQGVYIPPKSADSGRYVTINDLAGRILGLSAVIILPLLILITGGCVWAGRRGR